MNTMRCRSCGDLIGFLTTPAGKSVPVDPDLVKTFVLGATVRPSASPPNPGRRITLVTERGQIVGGLECSLTTPGAEEIEGYVSHFATCTDPARWRKKGPA